MMDGKIDWNDFFVEHGREKTGEALFSALESSSDSNVIPLPVSRKSFENEIDDAGEDVDAMISVVSAILASPLHEVEIEILLKRAAKKLGVSVASLRSGNRKKPPGEPVSDVVDSGFVDDLNKKHAIVPVSGRVLIMNQEYDPAMRRRMVTFSTSQDFQLRYSNQKTFVANKEVDIASAWLDHKDRRQYEGVVFAPDQTVEGYFNLFQGFGTKPSNKKSCDLFVEFLTDVICDQDSELFSYLWGWLSHLFQKPGELPGTAFVLRGRQGVGKNTFVDTIGRLVGTAHYIQLSSIQQVTGRFSGHLADVLLVFANEAIWGGDKTAEGALKHMVSDPITSVERKGRDIVAMNNFKRLIAASNEDWVIPRGMDDRRFIIVDVPDVRKEDHAYFSKIKAELENGGYEALMYDLMHADISTFNPREIPKRIKQNGWELKIRSGGSVMQWWFSMLDRGYLTSETGYGDEPVYHWLSDANKQVCHGWYLGWCEQHKISHPEIDAVMGRKLKEWGIGEKRSRGNGRVRHYVFPDLDQCREIFAEACGIPESYWNDSD